MRVVPNIQTWFSANNRINWHLTRIVITISSQLLRCPSVSCCDNWGWDFDSFKVVRNTLKIVVFGLIMSFDCKKKKNEKPITFYRHAGTVDKALIDHFSTACNYTNTHGLSLFLRYVLKLTNKLRAILAINYLN